MKKQLFKELVSGRKAYYNYSIVESFECGIVLLGTEVKSLRNGGGSLLDSFATINGNNVWLKNCRISNYKFSGDLQHVVDRDKKLLLNKSEIQKLQKYCGVKGYTLVGLSIYIKKNWIKVKIGAGKGKKSHDKREVLKERAIQRDDLRSLKY